MFNLDKCVLQLPRLIQPLNTFPFIMLATSRTSKSVTNSIYHPHETFNFSDKDIPSFSVWKPQTKLELKIKVLTGLFNFCKFFCSKCLQKLGSVSKVWVWIRVQFLEDAIYYLFRPQWLGELHKGGLIQKYSSAVHTT